MVKEKLNIKIKKEKHIKSNNSWVHLRHSRVYCVYAHFLLFKKLSDPPCKIKKKQLYWKEAPTQLPVFSCKIYEIFKKKIFYKIPPVAASDTFTLVFIYDFLLHIPSIIFRGAADPWSIWEYRWKPFWLNLPFDQQFDPFFYSFLCQLWASICMQGMILFWLKNST